MLELTFLNINSYQPIDNDLTFQKSFEISMLNQHCNQNNSGKHRKMLIIEAIRKYIIIFTFLTILILNVDQSLKFLKIINKINKRELINNRQPYGDSDPN